MLKEWMGNLKGHRNPPMQAVSLVRALSRLAPHLAGSAVIIPGAMQTFVP